MTETTLVGKVSTRNGRSLTAQDINELRMQTSESFLWKGDLLLPNYQESQEPPKILEWKVKINPHPFNKLGILEACYINFQTNAYRRGYSFFDVHLEGGI